MIDMVEISRYCVDLYTRDRKLLRPA